MQKLPAQHRTRHDSLTKPWYPERKLSTNDAQHWHCQCPQQVWQAYVCLLLHALHALACKRYYVVSAGIALSLQQVLFRSHSQNDLQGDLRCHGPSKQAGFCFWSQQMCSYMECAYPCRLRSTGMQGAGIMTWQDIRSKQNCFCILTAHAGSTADSCAA